MNLGVWIHILSFVGMHIFSYAQTEKHLWKPGCGTPPRTYPTHPFPFCTASPTHSPLWLHLYRQPNGSPCLAIQRCPHPTHLPGMVPVLGSSPSTFWGLSSSELAGPSPNHFRAMLCNGHTCVSHYLPVLLQG